LVDRPRLITLGWPYAYDAPEAESLSKGLDLGLVTSDIAMLGEDGLGSIRRMRKGSPENRVIAVFAMEHPTLIEARLLGAHAALEQPVTVEAVLRYVRRLSQGRGETVKRLKFSQ
jgi:DNA-binding NtrC family response regulator